ncbi:hypothetical protein B1987_11045 [Mycobacterium kansasii]|nr:hypothetical protein B1987_11045 [Mycobacterium kansasii]
MSFVMTAPETMTVAATDLAGIGSTISSANAAAAAPTAAVAAAGADEGSAAVCGLFSAYAREFQAVSAQAAAFHEQLVSLLNGGAAAYLSTEIFNAEQALISAVTAPAQTLLGHPLLGPTAAPATPGIAGPYQDLVTNTAANLQSLGSTWTSNPAPLLRRIVANQMAYGQTIATSLQNAVQDLGAVPADPTALNRVVADLFPIAAIPAQIQQKVLNIASTLTTATPAVALAALGPPLSALGGVGTAAAAFTGAVQTGDVAGAIGALIDAPAFVANGLLNGEVTLPLLLPLGLGLVVLDIPFDGVLAAPHAMTGTLVWFLPPFVDDVSGPPVSGIVPTLVNAVPQQLALAITAA